MKQHLQRSLTIDEWCALASAPGDPLPPVWIHVVSGSMLPLIRPFQDTMLLTAVRPEDLRIGDIVLFPAKCQSGNYCLHRVYQLCQDQVRTLGDACNHPDRWFPGKNVLGKVLVIRRGRHQIDCESKFWRIIFRLWMRLLFLRPLLLFPYRAACKITNAFAKNSRKQLP